MRVTHWPALELLYSMIAAAYESSGCSIGESRYNKEIAACLGNHLSEHMKEELKYFILSEEKH